MNAKASVGLRQRREVVAMTLRYVENERRQIECNAGGVAQSAYQQRAWLLDQLTAWYRAELRALEQHIDDLEKDGSRNA